MGAANFFDIFIEVQGAPEQLAALCDQCCSGAGFSLEKIVPTPTALQMELNNFVTDGYDALFGDWTKLAGMRMLQEPAGKLAYDFPLDTRQHLVECMAALGADGEKRLSLGRLYQNNLEQFGVGTASAWRSANWGCAQDVEELIQTADASALRLAFSCPSYPKKALALLSKRYDALLFVNSYARENGAQAKYFSLKKGKASELATPDQGEIHSRIIQFRVAHGLQWLCRGRLEASCAEALEMDRRGRAVLKGTSIALDFVRRRLADGESLESLSKRFSQINDWHRQFLMA